MDFELSADQEALQGLARRFAREVIAPQAADWWEKEYFPVDVMRQLGQLGLMGLLVPERYGGTDAGMVGYVAAMEEIGVADQSFAAAWNAHTTIGSLPLLAFGTEEQRERWLRPLAEGTKLGAFGLTEAEAGSDAAGIRTRAVRDGDEWVINGTKMFISNAGTEMSLGVTLLALTGREEDGRKRYGSFVVPAGTPGFKLGERLKKLGWHGLDTRELVFDDCRVPADHLVGAEGAGLRQFLEILGAGRISIAALSVSLARASLELALAHAKDRRQFGRSISEFQAIQHKLADIATELQAARWLTYRAASLYDAGRPYATEAAMAKLFASEVANRSASEALQIHGGYGYMRESAISRFYADAKILEIGEGTNEIQRTVIARALGC
ncbi:MAG: acyl-CoA dehydrogenase family protein [Acidimicrobiales bacterium]|nr:acyl-CoA dehydrogenase family protein [Acidimicrobiales bacterium]